MDIVILTLLLVFSFTIRALPRKGFTYAFSGDTFFHLYMGNAIRKNNFKIPDRIPNVVLDHEYTYPYLYHLFLSVFSKEKSLKIEKITGAIFDTINALAIYIFVSWSVNYFQMIVPSYFSFLITLSYIVSPALLTISAGPRAYSGSPRVIGQTLYIIHITTFFYYSVTGDFVGFFISILFGSLLFITAKFGVQVLVFFGVIFIFLYSPVYSIIILLSFIISVFYTRGRSWKVLSGQIKHSEFYFLFMKSGKIFGFKSDLQDIKIYLARLLRNSKQLIRGRVFNFIEWVFSERYFLHFSIIAFPQVIFLLIVYNKIYLPEILLNFLLIWFAASLIWFLLTSFGFLKFLGEGERYIEYSVTASFFLAGYYLVSNELYLWIVVYFIYSLFIYFLHVYLFRKRHSTQTDDYYLDEELFEKLNSLPKGILLPFGNEWQTLYRSKHPLLTYGANIDVKRLSVKYFKHLFYNAHMPADIMDEFINKFNLRYILTTPVNLDFYLNNVCKDDKFFKTVTEKVAESKNYILFKING